VLFSARGVVLGDGVGPRNPVTSRAENIRIARAAAMPPVTKALLVMLFMLLAATVTTLGQERSGWLLMTHPSEPLHASNSLFGYAALHGASVLHKENLSFLQQIALFSGVAVPPDLYFRRPLFSLAAAHLAPVFGMLKSVLVVNLVAWALAAYLSARLANTIYRNHVAGAWAAAFSIAGLGFIAHALDFSAHLLSFTFYFAGVVLFYELDVWRTRLPRRTHLLIAVFLAFAAWQYNTGLALTASYVLLALRRNRWRDVAMAGALALLAQPLWQWWLAIVFHLSFGQPLPDLSLAERTYFLRAIHGWSDLWSDDAAKALMATLRYIGQFLCFECPLTVACGVLALVFGSRARQLAPYAVVLIAMPMLASLVFATSAAARGYLVYGIAIFIYVALAGALANEPGSRSRMLAGFGLLAAQLAWNLAHTVGYLGPLKSYFLGLDHALALFAHGAPEVVSLTGLEPTPYAFGAHASLQDAGLQPGPSTVDLHAHPLVGIFVRAPFVALGCIAIVLLCQTRRKTVLGAFLCLELAAAAASLHLRSMPAASAVLDYAAQVKPATTLEYTVVLSPALADRLASVVNHSGTVQMYAALACDDANPSVHLRVGPSDVHLRSEKPRVWTVDAADLKQAFERGPPELVLSFTAGPSGICYYGGWQRVGLERRDVRAALSGNTQATILPQIELRVLDESVPVLVAY